MIQHTIGRRVARLLKRLGLLVRTDALSRLYDLNSRIQVTKLVIMSAVSISQLKADLSRYVREVRRGGEVEVLDRGVPVARMVAVLHNSEGYDQSRDRLIG